MFGIDPVTLGIILIILAAIFTGIAILAARLLPRIPAFQQPPVLPPALKSDLPPNEDALLLVQVGGRVVYTNQTARDWFGRVDEEPNLERLARRARPSEVFLELCAVEGRARFSLDGLFVEGISYYVPATNGDAGAYLVSMHRPQVTPSAEGATNVSSQALDIIAELSRAISASLDLETTLQAILESVVGLVPSDFAEICVWEAATNELIPYRLVGIPGIDQHLEQSAERYPADKGYAGHLLGSREALLINDVDANRELRPRGEQNQYPFQSYLGMPLLVGGEAVGTLEMASIPKNAFTDADQQVIKILSQQAAVALNNAMSYEEEERRAVELAGLAKLAQASSVQRISQDFYAHLVESIRSLVDVHTIGFLIYDEARRMLVAQAPFDGIPTHIVQLYHVTIQPGSPAEGIWLSNKMIHAQPASTDPTMEALGLAGYAVAAGIQNSILFPLLAAGNMRGYLQIADKKDGSDFSADDLRILSIVAGQSATIIENAVLVRESQLRTQRAEAMRRIASLAGSVATIDEILTFSVKELARLMEADFCAVYLLDENRGEIRLHRPSLFGAGARSLGRFARLSQSDPEYSASVTSSMSTVLCDEVSAAADLQSTYRFVAEAAGLHSLMAVPVIVRERGSGEIILGSKKAQFFEQSDLSLVSTTANQLAAALEKSTLYAQTDARLQRRVDQLTAINRVSRELNTNLELHSLLKLIYDELLHTTQAKCGSISILEPAAGDASTRQVFFKVGESLADELTRAEQLVVQKEETLLIEDYSQPVAGLDEGLLAPPHEGIRCSVIVPIPFQEAVAGLIHLHAEKTDAFDQTAIDIAQSLATQAAIGFGNATRSDEQHRQTQLLSRRVSTMETLLNASRSLSPEQPLRETMEVIAYGIQEATPFNVVVIGVYQAESGQLEWVTGAGLTPAKLDAQRNQSKPWVSEVGRLSAQYRMGSAYYIPRNSRDSDEAINGDQAWHAGDRLLLPLYDPTERPLGMIALESPRNGMRPDNEAIDGLELFASQASLIIESHQKLSELSKRVSVVDRELQRLSIVTHAAQTHLPTLLHKDLEQTLAIHSLSQRARRIQAVLDIGELVSRKTDRASILLAFGQEIFTRLEMDALLVAEPTAGGVHLLNALGSHVAGASLEILLGQRNPLRSALQSGTLIMASNVAAGDWKGSLLLAALEAQSFLCLPILAGSRVDAAILVIGQAALPAFTDEEEHLYELTCRQVGIALENLSLLSETSRRLGEVNLLLDFSRQVGTLDPHSILRTLVESAMKAIPAAQAGMVALWQPEESALAPQFATGYSRNERMLEIHRLPAGSIAGQAYEQGRALRIDEVNFAHDYELPPDSLMIYRDATSGRLPISSLIVPIQTGENKPGVLVLDNFTTSAAFTAEDENLVASLTRQTALTLENARLYQASEQRAGQLMAMSKLAQTITSSLQSNELIGSLLDQVKTIVPYDTGTLWLRQGKDLTIRAASGFADSEQRIGLTVAPEESLLLKEMIQANQPITVGDVRQDARFPALLEHKYLSWLGAPLVSKGEVIGVIALEKAEAQFYTPEHIEAMLNFTGQAGVALVNANLYEDSLQRATELDERSQRLTLLNRLSSELSGSLDMEFILNAALRELLEGVTCSGVSALLFDADGQAYLRTETPSILDAYPVPMPESAIFERLRETLGIFSTEEVAHEEILTGLQDFLSERRTHALLILPLVTGNDLQGLFFVYSALANRFDADELELARTVANQAAVALQNARLFAETQRLFAETRQRTTELGLLFELGVNITQMLDQDKLIETTFASILEMLKADSVSLVMEDAPDTLLVRAVDRGEPVGPLTIPRSGSSLSEYVIKTSAPLFIRDMDKESSTLPAQGIVLGEPVKCWLGVPLVVRGTTSGVLSVQSYTPNVFGDAQLRLLGQVGNSLAVALDNARLFEAAQTYAADLVWRVTERTQEVEAEHNRIQTLLSIITELSASLDQDLVLNRTLAVMNDAIGSEHTMILLTQPDDRNLYTRAALGLAAPLPKGGQRSSMRQDEGLPGWVLDNRQSALIPDLQADSRWIPIPDEPYNYRSAIAVPLARGEETLGLIMMYSRRPNQFTPNQLELTQAAAKQIAVAINNSQLYNLIRDQAERLGDMLRSQHIESSRANAMLEAVADGILVTDAERVITLFNSSAEQILDLNRRDVLGKSLESFLGLFGRAAHDWVQTIRTWSSDPASYQPGDTYIEQIELDDRRVVSVHLSPIRLKNDFLGTVSIFQDITHLVELDRLKSEFVATVSHELRTPMTSIKGYTEILLMGAAGDMTEQQTHFLQVVKSNTERLAILVNDLLDLSRIEAGRVVLSLQPLDINRMVNICLDTIHERIREDKKAIVVDTDLAAQLPFAFADQERFQQILDNLLSNAYQYTQDGGKIIVRARQVMNEIQIDVQDNGIGISAEDQPHIFERFFRGEDPLVLATSGTGLGLSIVRHLVEMHNGRIWFQSVGVPGMGSTFSFTMPVYSPGGNGRR